MTAPPPPRGDLEIVGDAGSAEEAVPAILRLEPDVVLLDVHMSGGGGRAVIEAVRAERPETRFLALSVSDAARTSSASSAPAPEATSRSPSRRTSSRQR